MSFLVNTSHRSSDTEIMDDFTMKGVLLRDTLDKLEIINRFLGGNSVTINGLKKILMNFFTKLIAISLFLVSCENVVNMEDLEEKNSIYYKKSSNIPYSGKIDGISFGIYTKGKMIDGKAEGEWFGRVC